MIAVTALFMPAPVAAWLAQTAPGPTDLSPFAYWGIAGALLGLLMWLFLDERKEHKALREKVLTDVLPALIENNEQMKESAAATVMMHQMLARPSVDPGVVNDVVFTLRRVQQRLDEDDRRRER